MKTLTASIVAITAALLFFAYRQNTPSDPEDVGPLSSQSPATEPAAGPDLALEIEREKLALDRNQLALERAEWEAAAKQQEAEKESALERAVVAAPKLQEESVPHRVVETRPKGKSPVAPSAPDRFPARPPVEQGDYSVFYDALEEDGDWFETDEYGYVWQPHVVGRSPDWRPYTEGRWMDTDQGWAWWSDEPYGWAVYHYGRWTELVEVGWIWVPGDQWAPAWVSWRECDTHIGWAPLPPVTVFSVQINFGARTDTVCGIPPAHYNFVPVADFCEPVRGRRLPPSQNVTIINRTTNVTNIHIRNETVIVEGPRREPLRERFGSRMPRHQVNRAPLNWDSRHGRMAGTSLDFAAPKIEAVAGHGIRPASLAGRLEAPRSRHGAAAAPDAEMVRGFARERARLEWRAEREARTAVADAPKDAAPAQGIEAIRRAISQSEERIENLMERRNIALRALPLAAGEVEPDGRRTDAQVGTSAEDQSETRVPAPPTAQSDGQPRAGDRDALTPVTGRESAPSQSIRAVPILEIPREEASDMAAVAPGDRVPDPGPVMVAVPVDEPTREVRPPVADVIPVISESTGDGVSDVPTMPAPDSTAEVPQSGGDQIRADQPVAQAGNRPIAENPGTPRRSRPESVSRSRGTPPTPVSTQQESDPAVGTGVDRLTETEANARHNAGPALRDQAEAESSMRSERATRSRDEQARAQAEAQARMQAEQEASSREEQARAQAEAQARMQAEQEAARSREEQARAQAEAQARMQAEQEAARSREEQARAQAEAQARMQAEQEARSREEQARAQAEAQARMQAEQEARNREERARAQAEAQARMRAERETSRHREDRSPIRPSAENRGRPDRADSNRKDQQARPQDEPRRRGRD